MPHRIPCRSAVTAHVARSFSPRKSAASAQSATGRPDCPHRVDGLARRAPRWSTARPRWSSRPTRRWPPRASASAGRSVAKRSPPRTVTDHGSGQSPRSSRYASSAALGRRQAEPEAAVGLALPRRRSRSGASCPPGSLPARQYDSAARRKPGSKIDMPGHETVASQSFHWCSMSEPVFTYAKRAPRLTEPGSITPMRRPTGLGERCDVRVALLDRTDAVDRGIQQRVRTRREHRVPALAVARARLRRRCRRGRRGCARPRRRRRSTRARSR